MWCVAASSEAASSNRRTPFAKRLQKKRRWKLRRRHMLRAQVPTAVAQLSERDRSAFEGEQGQAAAADNSEQDRSVLKGEQGQAAVAHNSEQDRRRCVAGEQGHASTGPEATQHSKHTNHTAQPTKTLYEGVAAKAEVKLPPDNGKTSCSKALVSCYASSLPMNHRHPMLPSPGIPTSGQTRIPVAHPLAKATRAHIPSKQANTIHFSRPWKHWYNVTDPSQQATCCNVCKAWFTQHRLATWPMTQASRTLLPSLHHQPCCTPRAKAKEPAKAKAKPQARLPPQHTQPLDPQAPPPALHPLPTSRASLLGLRLFKKAETTPAPSPPNPDSNTDQDELMESADSKGKHHLSLDKKDHKAKKKVRFDLLQGFPTLDGGGDGACGYNSLAAAYFMVHNPGADRPSKEQCITMGRTLRQQIKAHIAKHRSRIRY